VGVTCTPDGLRIRRSGGQPVIRLVDVSKSFGNQHVIRRLSLDIHLGQSTVIIGPSGTGKSVLLKLIVGLLKPDDGEVHFHNQRVDQLDPYELVEVRKKIGFLFQMSALFDSLSVGDNVAFPLIEHTKLKRSQRDELVDRVLRMVGLSGIQKKMPMELSGGQRKRVALARSIVLEPEMVLYDEPTTGLDPIRSDLINELIVGLSTRLGITSIVVTHDMISACKIADRMILLYDGEIVHDGVPESFWKTDNVLVQRFVQGQADAGELDMIRQGLHDSNGKKTRQ
ncbi:MAG: ATP-binding cassette domain-containing protein, partial [Phycisphaeraceae bacterium]